MEACCVLKNQVAKDVDGRFVADEDSPSQGFGPADGENKIRLFGLTRVYRIYTSDINHTKAVYQSIKVFSNIAWGGQATEQGTTTAGWCYPETVSQRNYSTPHGTPEYVNRISLRGTWYAKEYLKFILQPAYVAIFNHNNQSGEKAFGFEIAAAVSINLIKF